MLTAACISLLIGLSACSPVNEGLPTPTTVPTTLTVPATHTPRPVPVTPTITPTSSTCRNRSGIVQQDVVGTTNPPQEFLIYLPPCYESEANFHFPVLYLLHGQTYKDDQWVRLGVPATADRLIHEGRITPFIIVFPDDRYWNVQAGVGFGSRVINDLIPYVDRNYRTFADRDRRSIGGLSRGGGWAIELGFSHPELFGALGLHSPAIKVQDGPYLERMIKDIPESQRPLIWMDIGDVDTEMGNMLDFEEKLNQNNYLLEFHLYPGDHSEEYWGAHVEEYLLWYAEKWAD